MKRWALLVAALYGLILLVLIGPAAVAGVNFSFRDLQEFYNSWAPWAWFVVMVLCQFSLLAVPVAVASRRPMTHRSLFSTVAAAGLMIATLVMGALYAVIELIWGEKLPRHWDWIPLALAAMTWVIWTAAFYRTSQSREPQDVISKQCRLLIRGSIAELLVAVPCHIIVRQRNYCCAAFMTFLGLTMGAAVLLFSFGPAVFFLFADRMRSLRPSSTTTGGSV
jgi:hypothetical protein